jgi:hypothetical protein
MQPGKYDLVLYKGDTYKWTFVIWQDINKTQPADLTNVTSHAQIRPTPGGPLAAELVCVITLPNIVEVSLTEALWAGITIPSGAWDLQLVYVSGEVKTPIGGTVTITNDITRVGVA